MILPISPAINGRDSRCPQVGREPSQNKQHPLSARYALLCRGPSSLPDAEKTAYPGWQPSGYGLPGCIRQAVAREDIAHIRGWRSPPPDKPGRGPGSEIGTLSEQLRRVRAGRRKECDSCPDCQALAGRVADLERQMADHNERPADPVLRQLIRDEPRCRVLLNRLKEVGKSEKH